MKIPPAFRRRIVMVPVLGVLGLGVIAAGLWAVRQPLAQMGVNMWLRPHGLRAVADIPTLNLHQIVLHDLRLMHGDDVALQTRRVVIDLQRTGAALRPAAVAIDGLQATARFDAKGLTLGKLESLRQHLMAQPPSDAPLPHLALRNSRVIVDTEAGAIPMDVLGGYDGQRAGLRITVPRLNLKQGKAVVDMDGLRLAARLGADGLRLMADGGVTALSLPEAGLTLRDARARAHVTAPITLAQWTVPDSDPVILADLPVVADLNLRVAAGQHLDSRLDDVTVQGQFTGAIPDDPLAVTGTGSVAARGRAGLAAKTRTALLTALSGPYRAVLDRALSAGRFDVHATLAAQDGHWTITPRQPVQLQADSGLSLRWASYGPLRISPRAQRITAPGVLNLQGGGGPDLRADLSRLEIWHGKTGLDVKTRGQLRYSGLLPDGRVRDGRVDLDARFAASIGGGLISAASCVQVAAAELVVAAQPLHDLSVRLCPTPKRALVVLDGQGWQVHGQGQVQHVHLPLQFVTLSDVQTGVALRGGAAGLQTAALSALRLGVRDTMKPLRFRPLTVSGQAAFAAGRWTLDGQAADRFGVLGQIAAHQDADGTGAAQVKLAGVSFAPKGRALEDAVPGLKGVASNVTGSVGGQIDARWRGEVMTATGQFSTRGLSAVVVSGKDKLTLGGIDADLNLRDLLTGTSAPDQEVRIATVSGGPPLSNLRVTYRLTPTAVEVIHAEGPLAGGVLHIEPFRMPYVPGPSRGVAVITGATGPGIVELLNSAGKFALTGIFDARVPFVLTEKDAKIEDGTFAARDKGEIRFETSGGANTPADMAMQALKHFRYDSLTWTISGDPAGRVAVGMTFVGHAVNAVELQGALPGGRTASIENVPFKFRLTTSVDLGRLSEGTAAATRSASDWSAEAQRLSQESAP